MEVVDAWWCLYLFAIGFMVYLYIWAATWQNKQNECAPSEDSDQPGHPPSLIRVFDVRMKKAWVLSYPLSVQRRLIRLGWRPGWSESSLGVHSLWWFCHVAAHIYAAWQEEKRFKLFSLTFWPCTFMFYPYHVQIRKKCLNSVKTNRMFSTSKLKVS